MGKRKYRLRSKLSINPEFELEISLNTHNEFILEKKKNTSGEFWSSQIVRISYFYCRGCWFNPYRGTRIPQVAGSDPPKKEHFLVLSISKA